MSTPEKTWARNLKVGDKVQHYLKRWPAQEITAIEPYVHPLSGITYLTFHLSGGSKATRVPESTTFLRYRHDL